MKHFKKSCFILPIKDSNRSTNKCNVISRIHFEMFFVISIFYFIFGVLVFSVKSKTSQYQQGNSKYSNCVIYFVLWLIIFVDINLSTYLSFSTRKLLCLHSMTQFDLRPTYHKLKFTCFCS